MPSGAGALFPSFPHTGRAQSNDAFYDRGRTFQLKMLLNGGSPEPKFVGMSTLFLKMRGLHTWAMEIFTGMQVGFC